MWMKEPKYAWFLIGFLWIFGFFGAVGRVVVQYYQGAITEDLGTDRLFLGYAWSASIMIGSFCAPLGGWLTDRLGYKITMVAGSFMGVLSTAVILLFPHPIGYLIGFGVLGGLAGLGASTSYVLVSQWFQHHRAKAMMIIGSAGSIGLAVLTPLFVINENWLTWRVAYKFSISFGMVFILLLILFIRERKYPNVQNADQPNAPDSIDKKTNFLTALISIKTYIRNPVLLIVIAALFTCGFSMGTVEMHFMAIQQTAHVSHSMFMASLSILGVLELLGGFVFAFLLDRMPRAIALSSLYFIRTIAFFLLFVHLQLSPVLFTLIFGATYLGAIPGGILLANESLRTQSSGLQTGMLLLFHQLGGVVAAIAGGLNYDLFHNYQILIGINIGLSMFSSIGYFLVREGRKEIPTISAPSV